MLFANKKLIHPKWLIPFLALSLSFQFVVYADCASKCTDPCVGECNLKIKKMMTRVINCSVKLKNKYNITESSSDSKSDASDNDTSEDTFDLMVVKLKDDCRQEKQATQECCSNPSSCNGFALDLAQHVAPLAPALLSAYKSYKISDDASKGEITHQKAVDKMCNAQNTIALGSFGAGLLSQLKPLMQKTCGKEIKKCKKGCNDKVDEFKQEFKNCYSKIFPNENISSMIHFAQKKCFSDIGDLDDESFELTKIDQDSAKEYPAIASDNVNKCTYSLKEGFKVKDGKENSNDDLHQRIALSSLLYIAKAYKNTTKNRINLTDKSDEKEVIDCGNQPNRVLDSSSRPGGPVSPPAIQLCQQAVDHAINNTPPPPMPGPNSGNNPGNIGPAGSLTGDTRGSNLSSLHVPAGEECQYGVVDSASLENCPIDDGDLEEDFDVNKKPGLAKNLPGFKSGGGSGSSSGAGPGGGGIGGAGSLAGDDPSQEGYGRGSSYAGDMSVGAGFPGGYESSSYGDSGSNNFPHREVAENSNDMKLDGMEMPFADEEDPNEEKSIFQIASERIQNFCDDYSCDK